MSPPYVVLYLIIVWGFPIVNCWRFKYLSDGYKEASLMSLDSQYLVNASMFSFLLGWCCLSISRGGGRSYLTHTFLMKLNQLGLSAAFIMSCLLAMAYSADRFFLTIEPRYPSACLWISNSIGGTPLIIWTAGSATLSANDIICLSMFFWNCSIGFKSLSSVLKMPKPYTRTGSTCILYRCIHMLWCSPFLPCRPAPIRLYAAALAFLILFLICRLGLPVESLMTPRCSPDCTTSIVLSPM